MMSYDDLKNNARPKKDFDFNKKPQKGLGISGLKNNIKSIKNASPAGVGLAAHEYNQSRFMDDVKTGNVGMDTMIRGATGGIMPLIQQQAKKRFVKPDSYMASLMDRAGEVRQRFDNAYNQGGLMGLAGEAGRTAMQGYKEMGRIVDPYMDAGNKFTGGLGQSVAGVIAGTDAAESLKNFQGYGTKPITQQPRVKPDLTDTTPAKYVNSPAGLADTAPVKDTNPVNQPVESVSQNTQQAKPGGISMLHENGVNTGVNLGDGKSYIKNSDRYIVDNSGVERDETGQISRQRVETRELLRSEAADAASMAEEYRKRGMLDMAEKFDGRAQDLMNRSQGAARSQGGMQRVHDGLQARGGLEGMRRDNELAAQRAADDRARNEALTRDIMNRRLGMAAAQNDYKGVNAFTQGQVGLQGIDSQRNQDTLNANAQAFNQNMKTLERKDTATARRLAAYQNNAMLEAYQGDNTKLDALKRVSSMMNKTNKDEWGANVMGALQMLGESRAEINKRLSSGNISDEQSMYLQGIQEENLKLTEFYADILKSIMGNNNGRK